LKQHYNCNLDDNEYELCYSFQLSQSQVKDKSIHSFPVTSSNM